MSRALASNAELSFEMTPDLGLNAETKGIPDDIEQLLEIRRGNINQEGKKKGVNSRSSPRIARKLRFSKDVPVEEGMDTN